MEQNGKRRRISRLAVGGAVLAALLAALFVISRWQGQPYTVTTFSMGAAVRQTVYGAGGREACASAAQAVRELDGLLSWRTEGGDVDRLNRAGVAESCAEIALDARTERVLRAALAVSEESQGAFDPTVLPVSRLWDFDNSPQVPGQAALEDALSQVDWRGVSLKDGKAALKEGASLDLGAVGKGAACDVILSSWRESGVDHGVAAVGGSVGLFGEKPWGRPWTVAVRDPKSQGSLGELSLSGGCVSTSGSYEKTFTQDGETYHHILDPQTGYPARSGLLSVTVWRNRGDGDDGALTDALATACFVLGAGRSVKLLAEFGAEGVFVTEDGLALVTTGLRDSFALTAEGYAREDLV